MFWQYSCKETSIFKAKRSVPVTTRLLVDNGDIPPFFWKDVTDFFPTTDSWIPGVSFHLESEVSNWSLYTECFSIVFPNEALNTSFVLPTQDFGKTLEEEEFTGSKSTSLSSDWLCLSASALTLMNDSRPFCADVDVCWILALSVLGVSAGNLRSTTLFLDLFPNEPNIFCLMVHCNLCHYWKTLAVANHRIPYLERS